MYESKVKYYYGTGRRKHSVARVRLYPGNGSITINGRSIDEYFGLDTLKLIVRQPLNLTENMDKMDVVCTVAGGGVTGQAGAIRHGISRALLVYSPELDNVTVSEHAASMGGSQIFLEPNEVQTVEVLTKSIAIASANDAAVAMAEFIGGSEDAFVELMNQKAKSLGKLLFRRNRDRFWY